MKIETLYVEHQRRYARTQLPPEFARSVIDEARHNAGVAGLAVQAAPDCHHRRAMRNGGGIDALVPDAIRPGAKSPDLGHHRRANTGARGIDMRGNVLVVLATVALFVAGLFVGVWTQRSRPVPPPPVGPMGEFQHPAGSMPAPAARSRGSYGGNGPGGRQPISPQELRKQLQGIIPQIADFQQKVDAIEQQFRTAFNAILTPEQKQKLDAITKRLASFPDPLPGCAPGWDPSSSRWLSIVPPTSI